MRPLFLCLLLLVPACDEGDGGGEEVGEGEGEDTSPITECEPERRLSSPDVCLKSWGCPSGEGCASGEGPVKVGFAKRDITPTGFELPVEGTVDEEGYWHGLRWKPSTFHDCGRDQLCPGDEGYIAPDADGSEGDEDFQAAWIAGFGNSRPAEGVHDPMWARCVAFSSGDTTVVIISMDLVGLFYNEVLEIRSRIDPSLGVDLVSVSSTHCHEVPDTLGQWGPDDGTEIPSATGRDPVHMEHMRAQAAACVEDAVRGLRPAELFAGMVRTGVDGLNWDQRDPFIIDDELPVLRAVDTDTGETLGTVVNWGSHPETVADENTLISSDFVHWVRETVEGGLEPLGDHPGAEGAGGISVYISGAVGGLISPLRTAAVDRDGTSVREHGFEKARIVGERVGRHALEALEQAELIDADSVSFAARRFLMPIRNRSFHVAIFGVEVFDRKIWNFDRRLNLAEDHVPWVMTEVDVIRVGPVTFFTTPGEVFPETVVGFDEEWSHGHERVKPDNENPPDMSAAPGSETPLKRAMPGDHIFLLGLGNDELGYLVPPYDFVLAGSASAYFNEAPGDHYEETNSIGPETLPMVRAHLEELAGSLGD